MVPSVFTFCFSCCPFLSLLFLFRPSFHCYLDFFSEWKNFSLFCIFFVFSMFFFHLSLFSFLHFPIVLLKLVFLSCSFFFMRFSLSFVLFIFVHMCFHVALCVLTFSPFSVSFLVLMFSCFATIHHVLDMCCSFPPVFFFFLLFHVYHVSKFVFPIFAVFLPFRATIRSMTESRSRAANNAINSGLVTANCDGREDTSKQMNDFPSRAHKMLISSTGVQSEGLRWNPARAATARHAFSAHLRRCPAHFFNVYFRAHQGHRQRVLSREQTFQSSPLSPWATAGAEGQRDQSATVGGTTIVSEESESLSIPICTRSRTFETCAMCSELEALPGTRRPHTTARTTTCLELR